MKPPAFVYHAPETVEEALVLLDRHGTDSKVLAGGQSLVPLLNFRLARPSHVIDINRLDELADLRQSHGSLHVGALTRQATLERSPMVAGAWPILREALGHLAHAQIRHRGTVGGSMAHADPSAELPVVFTALDARLHVRSVRRRRVVSCDEFFVTHLTTSVDPDELLVEIEVPPVPPGTGQAFVEFARRHGDFALGGTAVLVTLDERRHCQRATIALLGAAAKPVRSSKAEAWLIGRTIDAPVAAEAARVAVLTIEPTADLHGSTQYRKDLIRTLVERALRLAVARAEPRPIRAAL